MKYKTRKEYMKQWHLKNPEYMEEWNLKNKEYKKEHKKQWNLKNPEYNKEYLKQWHLKNKEHEKEYALKNKEHRKEYNKEYALKNREHINELKRNRLKMSPYLRLTASMRSGMSYTLQGTNKSAPTMKIIGCTTEGLFEHLESCSSWEPWMTRKKYGAGGWDVDHIIAIARWSENCPLQFALCWDKSNLQPMEHIANIKKGNRYEME